MNGAPLPTQVTSRWVSQQTRQINNEYYHQIVARNSESAVRYQREQLKAQAATAALNLRGQMEIAQRQDTTNQLLDGLAGDMGSLLGFAEQISGQLDSLNATAEQGFAAVGEVLNRTVAVLMEQQQTLTQIAHVLSKPYETKALELLREGQKWLETGAQTEGREQQENWKDALRLFSTSSTTRSANKTAWHGSTSVTFAGNTWTT